MEGIVMMQALPGTAGGGRSSAAMGKAPKESSFVEHMDRNMNAKQESRRDLLGVADRPAKPARESDAPAAAKEGKRQQVDDQAAETLAGLLQQFIAELEQLADQQDKPGAWTMTVPDQGMLEQLAEDAGMTGQEVARLLDQWQQQDGELVLTDFLAALKDHFSELQEEQPVTVAETNLPLIETLLARMGVDADQLEQLDQAAVTGDGRLDLGKLLDALAQLDQPTEPAALTDWEAAQLRDMLAEAGASRFLQQSFLPPRQEGPLAMTTDRLAAMLRQAVQEVEAGRPQVELPAFLSDLNDLLKQSGFEAKGAGWSPVVQESVMAAYETTLESVDLSTVKVEAAKAMHGKEMKELLAEKKDEESLEEWARTVEDMEASAAGAEKSGEEGDAKHDPGRPHQRLLGDDAELLLKNGVQSGHRSEHAFAARLDAAGDQAGQPAAAAARAAAPPPRMAPELQQQTFAQLSQGVDRGLRNQEHHLVLRLYPKELGEVKVEMMVRDDHVALSFAMENHRVKDVLESNMQQFRDNLAQQGYVLDECMVSVDQRESGNDGSQQPDFAWQRRPAAKLVSLAELPDQILYHRPAVYDGRDGSISLFI